MGEAGGFGELDGAAGAMGLLFSPTFPSAPGKDEPACGDGRRMGQVVGGGGTNGEKATV